MKTQILAIICSLVLLTACGKKEETPVQPQGWQNQQINQPYQAQAAGNPQAQIAPQVQYVPVPQPATPVAQQDNSLLYGVMGAAAGYYMGKNSQNSQQVQAAPQYNQREQRPVYKTVNVYNTPKPVEKVTQSAQTITSQKSVQTPIIQRQAAPAQVSKPYVAPSRNMSMTSSRPSFTRSRR